MNPLEYGKLIDQIDNNYIVQINETNIVKIVAEEDNLNRVKFFRKGELKYEFTDKKVNENTFIRILDKKQFTFTNNELVLLNIEKTVKFITPLSSLNKLTNKFITMDIETKNVFKKDLTQYYGSYTIFSEIDINKEISTILMSSNLDYNLINEIKQDTNLELVSGFKKVKSHVGIASAVTSYARIEMMELKMLLIKLGVNLYYTDTDSIFVDKELPEYLIGNELGQLKDELKGKWIKQGYFLGIKKYGYIDENNEVHSIFSGIERNSLSWNEIVQIANGFTVIKQSRVRFFKNLISLNITIKNSLETSIIFNPRKKLINNLYQPLKINNNILITVNYYLKIIKYRIVSLINKYNLFKLK